MERPGDAGVDEAGNGGQGGAVGAGGMAIRGSREGRGGRGAGEPDGAGTRQERRERRPGEGLRARIVPPDQGRSDPCRVRRRGPTPTQPISSPGNRATCRCLHGLDRRSIFDSAHATIALSATLEPFEHDGWREALTFGHPTHRCGGLVGHVNDQRRLLGRECCDGGLVRHVPRCGGCNRDARVRSDHRRTWSMAARTSSTLRGVIAVSVTITGWPSRSSTRAGRSRRSVRCNWTPRSPAVPASALGRWCRNCSNPCRPAHPCPSPTTRAN